MERRVLVKSDLLKFVNGNVLMDIDVPATLVVLLPLDVLSYAEAIIFVFGTNLKIFAKSSHDFLLEHIITRHKKIINMKRKCSMNLSILGIVSGNFQDKQKNDQQTDSPAASRSGFRLAIQAAANKGWNIFHMDLKTAFLQGEAYDQTRDIVCQIPPEMGYPPHIGARVKKPAYGLNDAPRRWWNILDSALRSYGLVPTRADRCTYVYYGKQLPKPALVSEKKSSNSFRVRAQRPVTQFLT